MDFLFVMDPPGHDFIEKLIESYTEWLLIYPLPLD